MVKKYAEYVELLTGENKKPLKRSTGYAVLSKLKAEKPEREIAYWVRLERSMS